MRSTLMLFVLLAFFDLALLSSCGNIQVFSEEDFYRLPKIDAHVHINASDSVFTDIARADHFRLLTINTDTPSYLSLDDQEIHALAQKRLAPGLVQYATSFTLQNWADPDWADQCISRIAQSKANGAIAVKVWKNIGMTYRDADSSFIMIDNPRFQPIWDFMIVQNIPLIGHLGEPRNCWLPLEEMTVTNDRNYFSRHPEYHMYLHPEYPSYQEQIDARDQLLANNPKLRFIGCHLGSLEWDVAELAKRFDRFPNMAVDMSARIGHLHYQTIRDREKVRQFFIKYQERLLYGSDTSYSKARDASQFKKQMHETWLADWKFFVTAEEMTSKYVEESFRGLELPSSVVEKIFYKNAQRWLPGL